MHPDPIALDLDQLWVLVAAALVFLMQAGFLLLEVGATRTQHGAAVGLKNLVDWVVVTLCFAVLGYGLMFGTGLAGLFGTDLFGLSGVLDGAVAGGPDVGHGVFFLFQLGFAGTAITIVSGAMAERTGFLAYTVLAAATGLVIYPVFGHWAWGGTATAGAPGWLAGLGFLDFAGSTVVHSVGGWIALVGIVFVGPRLGRFGADGRPRPLPPSNLGLSALGVLVLWLGWWGFNGGSTLALDSSVPKIIVVTSLAGAAAGLSAFAYACRRGRDAIGEKFLGGVLCGLVAVTASAGSIEPLPAVLLGVVAGLLHDAAFVGMQRLGLDDPVGAVPVHLCGGVLGTLAVALVAPASALSHGRLTQLGVQALGVLACAAWTTGTAALVLRLVRSTLGLRVSPAQERAGDVFGIVGRTAPAPAAPAPVARPVVARPAAGPVAAVPGQPGPAAHAVPAPEVAAGGPAEEIDDLELAELLG